VTAAQQPTQPMSDLRTLNRVRTIAWVDHTCRHPPPRRVLDAVAEAMTIQVERDFAPVWGVTTARFTAGRRGDKIHFFDSAHPAGDYGW
jgi:hypothetical protein